MAGGKIINDLINDFINDFPPAGEASGKIIVRYRKSVARKAGGPVKNWFFKKTEVRETKCSAPCGRLLDYFWMTFGVA